MPELRRISIRRLPSASHKPLLQSRSGADNKLQSDLQGRNLRLRSCVRLPEPDPADVLAQEIAGKVKGSGLDPADVLNRVEKILGVA